MKISEMFDRKKYAFTRTILEYFNKTRCYETVANFLCFTNYVTKTHLLF